MIETCVSNFPQPFGLHARVLGPFSPPPTAPGYLEDGNRGLPDISPHFPYEQVTSHAASVINRISKVNHRPRLARKQAEASMAKRQKIIAIVDDDPSMLRATVLPLDRHGLLSSLKTTLIDSKFAEDGLCLECQQCLAELSESVVPACRTASAKI